MSRRWLAGGMLLIGTALFSAHASPAKATRPLIHASGALEAVRLSTPLDLHDVLAGKTIGLRLEKKRDRDRVLTQAKQFHAYRLRGRAGQAAYIRSCGGLSERENFFCALETEILAEKATSAATKKRAPLKNGRVVAADLRAANLTELATYSSTELYRGTSQFDDFAPLQKVSNRVLATKECEYPLIANALASKAEESFPEASALETTRRLYARAAQCGAEPFASQARFRHGLLALWSKKYEEAAQSMRAIVASPTSAAFHGRAKLWLHHLAVISKNEATANEMRESLWRDHTLSFQNLAVNGRDQRIQQLLSDKTEPKVALRSLIRPDINGYLRAVEALLEIGSKTLAGEVADRFSSKVVSAEPEVRLYLAALMHREGLALPKFRILTSLFQDAPRLISRPTLQMLFPKRYFDHVSTKAKEVDPLLVLSLIRQESAFNANAHSIAGARGLMQVMPATARSFASVASNRLWDPKTNIDVGIRYLLHRLDRYDGDVELTLAAYNAGFSRVDRWIKRYPLENKLLFVDLIPFRETREYVSSILRNYFWYTQLYGLDGVDLASSGSASKTAANVSADAPANTLTELDKLNRILEANAGAHAPGSAPLTQ